MKSLFNKAENDAIINRINQLNNNSTAVWGKMDAAQMLAHCQVPLKVAFGEVKLKRGLIGILFGGLAKRKMVTDRVLARPQLLRHGFIHDCYAKR